MAASTKTALDQKSALIQRALQLYTARSGPELAAVIDDIYTPTGTFIDPFVVATPRHEARLQFLSLQHLFDAVTAVTTSSDSSETQNDDELRANVHFEYFWSRQSWLARKLLPEMTPVDAKVVLQLDPVSKKIATHTDEWNSPSIPHMPAFLRMANCKLTNAVFRLLNFEKEFKQGGGGDGDGDTLKSFISKEK